MGHSTSQALGHKLAAIGSSAIFLGKHFAWLHNLRRQQGSYLRGRLLTTNVETPLYFSSSFLESRPGRRYLRSWFYSKMACGLD